MLDAKFAIPDPSAPRRERTGVAPSARLIPFQPKPLQPQDIAGRRIIEASASVGTYGMGGLGYFGLRLESAPENRVWLVIALRGAASWMMADGRLVEDFFWQDASRSQPWIEDARNDLTPRVAGRAMATVDVREHELVIRLDDGFELMIESDPASRPIFHGSKLPRAFDATEDLRRNVFLAPTDEIWA